MRPQNLVVVGFLPEGKGKKWDHRKEVGTDEEEDDFVRGRRDDATYYCVSGVGRSASYCPRTRTAHGP